MTEKIYSLAELFHRLLNKAISKEMVPRVLDSGELLYRIEIHVIAAIAEHPDVNLTGLAEILGVTKGAVSQKVKILEKKGYILKYKSPDNNKEILFGLTDKGHRINLGHIEFHKQLNEKFLQVLGNTSEIELENFLEIIRIIERHFETL